MLIYIAHFALILLYGFLVKDKKKLVVLASLQTFLILALRAPTLGVDLDNYSGGFEYIKTLGFGDLLSRLHLVKTAELVSPYAYESGYTVINWIIGKLGFGFHGFLVIYAGFCTFSVGRFIYKYCSEAWLGFILFVSLGFFEITFGILRQTLAMSILLFAIPLINKKKPFRFFLLCLLAFTVHRVAIILVPLYFISRIKLDLRRYVAILICELGLFAISPVLAKLVLEPLLHALGKTRYTVEFNMNMQVLLMFTIALLILLFTSFEDTIREHEDNNMLLWMFLLSLAVEVVGMYNDVVARAVYIPYMAAVALVPNVLARYRHTGVVFIGKVALTALAFVFMVYQLWGSEITPYVAFFQ